LKHVKVSAVTLAQANAHLLAAGPHQLGEVPSSTTKAGAAIAVLMLFVVEIPYCI